jgi:hypothetical protein
MSECELDLMEKQRSDETAKELEYFVKLDNSDEEKRILDWHELESAYESENNRKNVKKCMMNI